MSDIERQAREAATANGYPEEWSPAVGGFVSGYLAAAEPREKRIAELTTKNIGLTGYDERRKWEESVLNEKDAEIEALRARVKDLEAMMPRWVSVSRQDEIEKLGEAGWTMGGASLSDGRHPYVSKHYLMVPPIPLPTEKEKT